MKGSTKETPFEPLSKIIRESNSISNFGDYDLEPKGYFFSYQPRFEYM